MNDINDCYILNNGISIPCMGFGTWKAEEGGVKMLGTAINTGYRYFDTASFYGTEEHVGQAIRESGIDRKKFFLASKVWKDEMGYENTIKAFEGSLKRLQTDYLDLYLIHWPLPDPNMSETEWKELDLNTWKAMERLYSQGKIRAIGVSNFLPHHLQNLLLRCKVTPAINQLEIHPGYTQSMAAQFSCQHGIQVQAWSPLGRGRLDSEPLMVDLAEKYKVSRAQICLRFLLQKGYISIPKSSSAERMKQNMDIFKFAISTDDMYRIETLPQAGWSGEHPDYKRTPII